MGCQGLCDQGRKECLTPRECEPNLWPPEENGISLDWVLFAIAVGLIYMVLVVPIG